MATKGKGITAKGRRNVAKVAAISRSVEIARRGVQSSEDYRSLMCALMTDVIRGAVSPEIANAATNAGRALVRIVELEYKMSTNGKRNGRGLLIARPVAEVA